MAKPSQLPEWNSGGANRVDPTAPEKVLGWTLNQKPPSSTFNWWMWTVYAWVQYLDAGLFDGDIEIDGTLTVDPAVPPLGPVVTIVGDVGVTGSAEFSGDVTIGGDYHHGTAHSKVIKANVGAYMTSGAGFVQGVSDGQTGSGTGNPGGFGGAGALQYSVVGGGGTCDARMECNLEAGSQFTQVKVLFDRVTGATQTINVNIYNITTNVHSVLQTFTTADFGALAAGNNLKTCTLTTPITLAHGQDISVSLDGSAVGDKFRAIQPYWTRP
jgi:hypothetical protein